MVTTLRRAGARSGSALALLGLLLGLPAGLLHYVGSPLPSTTPTMAGLADVFTQPLSDRLLLTGMAIVVWLLWLLLAASILVEAVAAVRGVSAPRPTLLRPTQALAAVLVAGLTAGVFAPTAITPLGPSTHAAAPVSASTVLAGHRLSLAALTVTRPAVASTVPVTLVINGCGYHHEVVRNESLWHIAQVCLGDPYRWPEIFELNKGRYWPQISGDTALTNPDLIYPGWELTLPADAVAPAGAQPVDPPIAAPAPPLPSAAAPTPPAVSSSPTPASPAATPSAPAEVSPPSSASAAPAGPTTIQRPDPQHSQSGDEAGQSGPADEADLVVVVGGFITTALAAGLMYAAAMVWRRRRQRYRPTPITTALLDDPDLTPPLPALTHLRQVLRRQRPDLLEPAPTGPTVREYLSADVPPVAAPAGPSGTEVAGVAALQVSAGLGLAGPGALAAARALLVSGLTSGRPDDPGARTRVVVPASTLATLLGVSAVDLPAMDRFTVAATINDAITAVEEEIIGRTRFLAEHDVNDLTALHGEHPLTEPVPQLLLLTDVPDPRQHQRLANAVHLGEKVGIAAVLVGAWPLGATVTVAADGTATGTETTTARVAVLDTDATAIALAMLSEAAGVQPVRPAAGTHREPVTPSATTSTPVSPQPDHALEPPAPADLEPAVATRVRVLGSPAVIGVDGQPINGIRGKAVELLVYLALHRNGAPLSAIMEALWPDATLGRAKERLSTNVAVLRKALRTARVDEQPADDSDDVDDRGNHSRRKSGPIPNTGSHYHLDPALVQVDLWTVLDQYARVAAAGDDHTRLCHLSAAVDAIGGGLAEGKAYDYDWIDTDREHVRRHLIKLYTQLADLVGDDDPHRARTLSDDACRVDPLSDELARRAMRAAAAVADTDAIRHRINMLRKALDDNDLTIEDETERLADELLEQLAQRPRAEH